MMPAMATAAVSRMVAIGRRIAGAARFTPPPSSCAWPEPDAPRVKRALSLSNHR